MALVTNSKNIKPDLTLNDEKGFTHMELRWLISDKNAPVSKVTIGHTYKIKGGEHRLHFHTDADEVIYMLKGKAIEKIDDEEVVLNPGDCCFIPRNSIHSHVVVEAPVETLCIYIGAPSFEKTGYHLVEQDKAKAK